MINTEEFNEDKENQALIDFFNELEEKDNVSTKKKSIEPIEALTPSKKKPKRIWEEEKASAEITETEKKTKKQEKKQSPIQKSNECTSNDQHGTISTTPIKTKMVVASLQCPNCQKIMKKNEKKSKKNKQITKQSTRKKMVNERASENNNRDENDDDDDDDDDDAELESLTLTWRRPMRGY